MYLYQMINLSSGECIYYHKLCLCTGAKPMMIIKDHSDVIAIRDTESVESLRNKLSTARRVIVVGNGGIATELVYEMKTCDIVWVVKDSSICTKFVDEGAAKFLLDHLYQQYSTSSTDTSVVHTVQPSKPLLPVSDDDGTPQSSYSGAALGPDWSFGMFGKNPCANVHIEYLSEIVKVDANGNELYATHQEHWPLFVTLSNGKVIGCDFVISATGVQPNIGYINDSVH
jgi:NAD(P)H-nitrite reductase large subunit